MKDTVIDYALLSTSSTALGRIRGFTVNVLFMLKEGAKRCCDIANESGKGQDYVHQYLKNVRKYGLALKNGCFWELTDSGVEFAKYLRILYNNKEYEKIKKERKKEREKKPLRKLKQVSIQAWLLTSTLDDIEKRVVEVLIDHFNKTGSKFKYFNDYYEAAEFFKATPDQIVEAMKHLKQDKIAYPWRDRSLNAWKIALYKDFVEELKLSHGEE